MSGFQKQPRSTEALLIITQSSHGPQVSAEIAAFGGRGGGEPAGLKVDVDADAVECEGVGSTGEAFENMHFMVWRSGDAGKCKRAA